MFKACFLDEERDPVERWQELSRVQQGIVVLAGKREGTRRGSGTDLRFSIEGRTFINSDGQRNFPSGEVSRRRYTRRWKDISH